MKPLLEVRGLSVRYGPVRALEEVSLALGEGEVVAVLGPNGAGKSTLLRAISGLVAPWAGEVWFEGGRITGWPPQKVARLGIAHVPEGRRLFPYMTVRENLLLGAYLRPRRDEVKRDLARVLDLFPALRERLGRPAFTLSGGEQQMLAIGRALMARPRLLLLDEPSLGLSPRLVKEIARIISEAHRQGVAILLVEQNAALALRLAQRGYLLERGRVVMEGPAGALLATDIIRRAYLGAWE